MDYERMIEFLLEQQARFSADVDELKAEDKRLAGHIGRLTSLVERVIEIQQRTQLQLQQNQEQVRQLVEAGKEATERINISFHVVDGMMRKTPPQQPPPA